MGRAVVDSEAPGCAQVCSHSSLLSYPSKLRQDPLPGPALCYLGFPVVQNSARFLCPECHRGLGCEVRGEWRGPFGKMSGICSLAQEVGKCKD